MTFRLNTNTIRAVLDALEAGDTSVVRSPSDWPALSPMWSVQDEGGSQDVYMLVEAAQDEQLITSDAGRVVFIDGGQDDDGHYYQWAIDMPIPMSANNIRVTDYADSLRYLGGRQTTGADAAKNVLRAAVVTANELQRRLDLYVTRRNAEVEEGRRGEHAEPDTADTGSSSSGDSSRDS